MATPTGQTDFTGIVNALQMLSQAIGQNGKSLDSIAAALGLALPLPSPGTALDMIRINAAGTAYEARTPAQVASDIGVVPPPLPATVAPLVDGTAAVGTSLLYARQDHVHPAIPGWQTLASYTPSAVASQAILLPSGFRRYRFTLQGATNGSTGANMQLQVSINGGVSYISSSSYAQFGIYLQGTTPTGYNSTATSALFTLGLTAGQAFDSSIVLYPGTASLAAAIAAYSLGTSSTPLFFGGNFNGQIAAGAVVNAVLIAVTVGTFSGTIILEGLP